MFIMEKFITGLGVFTVTLGIILLASFITAYPAMLLWNWLMPTIFGLTTLTFWQTLGLIILAHIIFPKSSSNKN